MSHYSKIFHTVPVDIPNKSGFDLSHENCSSFTCGTLVPAHVSELLPGDTVSLGVNAQIALPPMATDFFGRIKGVFETFFVPYRVLFGPWQQMIELMNNNEFDPLQKYSAYTERAIQLDCVPKIEIASTDVTPGSLLDYLGFRGGFASQTLDIPNALPLLAYHKIYDDWYRDSRVQRPVFWNDSNTYAGLSPKGCPVYAAPWAAAFTLGNASSNKTEARLIKYLDPVNTHPDPDNFGAQLQDYYFFDGHKILDLRQRNFAKDYFTNATARPQYGEQQGVTIASTGVMDEDTGEITSVGTFSIAALRAANSLQQFLERNNMAGERYGDIIKAHFGIYPADATTNRCLYLGRQIIDVYNKSVFAQADVTAASPKNPFVSVGAKYASPLGIGDGSLANNFTATEHGFLFTMFSLVPEAIYGNGIKRMFARSSVYDFPWPMLAGIGDQSIFDWELTGDPDNGFGLDEESGIYGYTQRYAEMKYEDDECHGLLADGEDLESFCMKRTFIGSPVVGNDMLQIPIDYLDQVQAVDSSASGYSGWFDAFFNYKKITTLPAYSIPTLGDLKNVHTEIIENGGKRL